MISSGLVFIGASADNYLRAFDEAAAPNYGPDDGRPEDRRRR